MTEVVIKLRVTHYDKIRRQTEYNLGMKRNLGLKYKYKNYQKHNKGLLANCCQTNANKAWQESKTRYATLLHGIVDLESSPALGLVQGGS